MNPRTLAAWSTAALLISLLTNNPVYRGLVVLAAVNLLATRSRRGQTAPLARFILVLVVLGITLNLFLGHAGVHVLARLPAWMPLVGGPMTLESVAFGAATALGIAAAVLAVAPITAVGEIDETVDALPAVLQRTGASVAAALNLVPALARSFLAVREAQLMRGWRPRRLGVGSAVLVPVMLTAIESSVELAEAMESRAYGSGPRTSWQTARWSRSDTLILLASALAVATFIAARVVAAPVDWYPFPALNLPSVQPILAAACLLLLAPSVTWSRAS